MKATSIRAATLAAFALALAALAPASGPPQQQEQALSPLIDHHLRSGGSWFTPAERAVSSGSAVTRRESGTGPRPICRGGPSSAAAGGRSTIRRCRPCSARRRLGSRLGSRR